MKRRLFAVLLVVMIIVVYFIIAESIHLINYHTAIFVKAYPTPTAAVEKLKPDEIYGCLQDDKMAMVFYRKRSSIEYKYFYHFEGSGWKSIYENHTPFPVKSIKNEDYILHLRKYKDQYSLYISSPNEIALSISDNIKSEFQYVKLKYRDYSSHEWFLTLDELPENYVITINGENIPLN